MKRLIPKARLVVLSRSWVMPLRSWVFQQPPQQTHLHKNDRRSSVFDPLKTSLSFLESQPNNASSHQRSPSESSSTVRNLLPKLKLPTAVTANTPPRKRPPLRRPWFAEDEPRLPRKPAQRRFFSTKDLLRTPLQAFAIALQSQQLPTLVKTSSLLHFFFDLHNFSSPHIFLHTNGHHPSIPWVPYLFSYQSQTLGFSNPTHTLYTHKRERKSNSLTLAKRRETSRKKWEHKEKMRGEGDLWGRSFPPSLPFLPLASSFSNLYTHLSFNF